MKSHNSCDLERDAVRQFYGKALANEQQQKIFELMKKELLKWHTDRIPRLIPSAAKDDELTEKFKSIVQVVIEIRKKAGGPK